MLLGHTKMGQGAHFLGNGFSQIDLIYILKTFAQIYNKKIEMKNMAPTLIGYDLYS